MRVTILPLFQEAEIMPIIDTVSHALVDADKLPLEEKVELINKVRELLHEISPFKDEPVDFVRWIKNPLVHANDYNPNSVAPPEMELLRLSIASDGYTQPIVGMSDEDGKYEVIDGFHRHRVGKECNDIQSRVHGYLPVVEIKGDRRGKNDRMAATIRHNRARGKHKVDAMSDIVIELKRRNWSDEKIGRELGMEPDEVLRLCQISGLSELFQDQEFSKSWDIGEFDESVIELEEGEAVTEKNGRIYHTYEKWECYPAGFYENKPLDKSLTKDDCERAYAEFLKDIPAFESAMERVLTEWPMSAEHYLSNENMNRIAWLGQASVCIAHGIPSIFCAGFNLLNEAEQSAANLAALKYLNKWLVAHGKPELAMDEAQSKTKANIY